MDKYLEVECRNCGSHISDHELITRTKVIHRGIFFGEYVNTVICTRCALVFLNPQPSPLALQSFYKEEYFGEVSQIQDAKKNEKNIWQRNVLFPWLNKNVPNSPIGKILDVGSGHGDWLSFFDSENQVEGIEASKQAADFCRGRFGFPVSNQDFLTNNFPPEKFDLVTALSVIEHFNNPLEALVEANRILRPGGYLYLSTPDLSDLTLVKGIEKYFKLAHTYYYTPTTLKSLLEKSGFEVVASRQREKCLESANFLYPTNCWDSQQDFLAKKISTISLDEAKQNPFISDSKSVILAQIRKAEKRDLWNRILFRIYRKPAAKRIRKLIIRLCKRVGLTVAQPISKYEVQNKKFAKL